MIVQKSHKQPNSTSPLDQIDPDSILISMLNEEKIDPFKILEWANSLSKSPLNTVNYITTGSLSFERVVDGLLNTYNQSLPDSSERIKVLKQFRKLAQLISHSEFKDFSGPVVDKIKGTKVESMFQSYRKEQEE